MAGEEQTIYRNNVLRSTNFYEAFADYRIHGENVSKMLNEKKHRLGNKDVTYRILNHWEELGLLTSERKSGKSWRKYSTMDIIWVNIMSQLRKFGFSLAAIKKAKENLGAMKEYLKYSDFPYLEFCVTQAVFFKLPVILVVFQNGDAEPLTPGEYNISFTQDLDHHIVIQLYRILQGMYPKKDFTPDYNSAVTLLPEEKDLLFMIRLQDYETITLKTNDGKIEKVEASKSEKRDSRIIDLIQSGDYQKIEIIQRNNKIVHIKKTIQKNYKKNGK